MLPSSAPPMAKAPSRPRPINGAGAPRRSAANAGIAMKQSHVANVNIFICATLEARFAATEAWLYEFRMPSSGPYGLTLTAYCPFCWCHPAFSRFAASTAKQVKTPSAPARRASRARWRRGSSSIQPGGSIAGPRTTEIGASRQLSDGPAKDRSPKRKRALSRGDDAPYVPLFNRTLLI